MTYHSPGPCKSMLMRRRPVPGPSGGQFATVTTLPSCLTSRDGRPSPSSHATARSPRTMAAVLAMFAATHVRAATLTVRQQELAGIPVRGSMM